MKDKIIVALDGMDEKSALAVADKLSGAVWGFKVNDLLLQRGTAIVTALRSRGRVFADPKLYDIPNTVGNGVRALADAGADLITVHISGGRQMLQKAVEASGSAKILGVTVLTSFDDASCREVYERDAAAAVQDFVRLADECGVPGIVCSPKELPLLTAFSRIMKVTPGVRPSWHGKADDQARTSSPKETVANGADLIVVGRPITEHADPVEAVRLIVEELSAR